MINWIVRLFENRVLKNFSYLTVGTILSQILSLFSILKITHLLSPGDYGLFSFLSVQGLMLNSIADLGLKNIVVRSIARDHTRAKDMVANGALLKGMALMGITAIYIVYNMLYGRLTDIELCFVFSFALINCLYVLFENAFFGRQEMFIPTLITLLYSCTWFICIYTIPSGYLDVSSLFGLFLFLNLCKATVCYVMLRQKRLLAGLRKPFKTSARSMLGESWPYFVLICVMLPFTMLSNNFLDINSTSSEVGYFNLSQKILGPISLVVDIALVSMFPNLSSLWIKDRNRFLEFVSTAFRYFVLFSLLLCFVFTLFADEVISALFSNSYSTAIEVSQLQIWYVFLASVDSLIGTILGSVNKEKVILRCALLKALVCTPALYFGSKYGAIGLAYAYIISVAVFQVYVWFVFLKNLNLKIKHIDAIWFVALAAFLVSYFLPSDILPVYRLLLAGSVTSGVGFYIVATSRTKAVV